MSEKKEQAEASRQTSHRPQVLKGAPPLTGLRGLHIADLPHDIMAGLVVAALTIPLSMGYAGVIGLPEIYGLYASIVAPIAFALISGTRHIVFGMDSAVSAMTGSMIAALLAALPGATAEGVIVPVTLLVAIFLILFSFIGLGKIVRYVPVPVMHGFVVGVSLGIIVGQLPKMLGIPGGSGSLGNVAALAQGIGQTSILSLVLGLCCIAALVALDHFVPRVPSALVVLILASVISAIFNFKGRGVAMVAATSSGLPMPVLFDISALGNEVSAGDIVMLIAGSAAIAIVVSIESLLCLKTFSMKLGQRPDGNRELLSFGVANAVVGIFGCPPCSASISRTAAALSGGSRSQVTSLVAAAAVAAIVALFAPALGYLPLPVLSAVVIVAMVEVIDVSKIARYISRLRIEMVVFLATAIVVFVWGAIVGVAVGFVVSLVVELYRVHRRSQQALIGVVPRTSKESKDKLGSHRLKAEDFPSVAVFTLKGNISFLNVNAIIDELLDRITPQTNAIIIKMSKLRSLDVTATDELIQTVEMLHARGLHVKLVRKMRPANDSYTRHEIRQIMKDARYYPSVWAALASLEREGVISEKTPNKSSNKSNKAKASKKSAQVEKSTQAETTSEPQAPATPVWTERSRRDGAVFTIEHVRKERIEKAGSKKDNSKRDVYVVDGKLALIVSGKHGFFTMRTNGRKVLDLKLVDAHTGEPVANLTNGVWSDKAVGEKVTPALDNLMRYVRDRLPELAVTYGEK